jgi:hypothetical protein
MLFPRNRTRSLARTWNTRNRARTPAPAPYKFNTSLRPLLLLSITAFITAFVAPGVQELQTILVQELQTQELQTPSEVTSSFSSSSFSSSSFSSSSFSTVSAWSIERVGNNGKSQIEKAGPDGEPVVLEVSHDGEILSPGRED